MVWDLPMLSVTVQTILRVWLSKYRLYCLWYVSLDIQPVTASPAQSCLVQLGWGTGSVLASHRNTLSLGGSPHQCRCREVPCRCIREIRTSPLHSVFKDSKVPYHISTSATDASHSSNALQICWTLQHLTKEISPLDTSGCWVGGRWQPLGMHPSQGERNGHSQGCPSRVNSRWHSPAPCLCQQDRMCQWVLCVQGGWTTYSQSSGKQRGEKKCFLTRWYQGHFGHLWVLPWTIARARGTAGTGVSAATGLQQGMPLGEHSAPRRVNN